MSSGIYGLLIVVLVAQLASCVEDADISIETRLKLHKAIVDTIVAKKQSGEKINAITRVIEKKIDVALDPIEKDIVLLKLDVNVAEQKARAQGVDISECVQAVRDGRNKIDKDHVKNCKHTPETNKAGEQMALIGKEIEGLKYLERACAKNANADQCVLKGIETSAKSTAAHQKEVAAILKKARPESADKCINKNVAELKSQVDNLRKDWTACLEKHNMKEL